MTSTLRYVPTRQRDRYRVFDGDRFLGVVERPRYGWHNERRHDFWVSSVGLSTQHYTDRSGRMNPLWFDAIQAGSGLTYTHLTRTEAAEALREMRAA